MADVGVTRLKLPGLDGCDKCIVNVVTAYFKVRAVRTFTWSYWKESIELWKYIISVPIFERQIQSKNISNPTLDFQLVLATVYDGKYRHPANSTIAFFCIKR